MAVIEFRKFEIWLDPLCYWQYKKESIGNNHLSCLQWYLTFHGSYEDIYRFTGLLWGESTNHHKSINHFHNVLGVRVIQMTSSECKCYWQYGNAGISIGMRPANGRRRYNATTSLIGWVHTHSDPSNAIIHGVYMPFVWLRPNIYVIGNTNKGMQESV